MKTKKTFKPKKQYGCEFDAELWKAKCELRKKCKALFDLAMNPVIRKTLRANKKMMFRGYLIIACEVMDYVSIWAGDEKYFFPHSYREKIIKELCDDNGLNSEDTTDDVNIHNTERSIKCQRLKLSKDVFKNVFKGCAVDFINYVHQSNLYINKYYKIENKSLIKIHNIHCPTEQRVECSDEDKVKYIKMILDIIFLLMKYQKKSYKALGDKIISLLRRKYGINIPYESKDEEGRTIFHKFIHELVKNNKKSKGIGRPLEEHVGDPSKTQLHYARKDCKRFCKKNNISYLEVHDSDMIHEFRNYRRNHGKIKRKKIWYVFLKIYLKLRKLESYYYILEKEKIRWYKKAIELARENKWLINPVITQKL